MRGPPLSIDVTSGMWALASSALPSTSPTTSPSQPDASEDYEDQDATPRPQSPHSAFTSTPPASIPTLVTDSDSEGDGDGGGDGDEYHGYHKLLRADSAHSHAPRSSSLPDKRAPSPFPSPKDASSYIPPEPQYTPRSDGMRIAQSLAKPRPSGGVSHTRRQLSRATGSGIGSGSAYAAAMSSPFDISPTSAGRVEKPKRYSAGRPKTPTWRTPGQGLSPTLSPKTMWPEGHEARRVNRKLGSRGEDGRVGVDFGDSRIELEERDRVFRIEMKREGPSSQVVTPEEMYHGRERGWETRREEAKETEGEAQGRRRRADTTPGRSREPSSRKSESTKRNDESSPRKSEFAAGSNEPAPRSSESSSRSTEQPRKSKHAKHFSVPLMPDVQRISWRKSSVVENSFSLAAPAPTTVYIPGPIQLEGDMSVVIPGDSIDFADPFADEIAPKTRFSDMVAVDSIVMFFDSLDVAEAASEACLDRYWEPRRRSSQATQCSPKTSKSVGRGRMPTLPLASSMGMGMGMSKFATQKERAATWWEGREGAVRTIAGPSPTPEGFKAGLRQLLKTGRTTVPRQ